MHGSKAAAEELRNAARSCQEGGKIDDVVEIHNRQENNAAAVCLELMRNEATVSVRFRATLDVVVEGLQPDYPTKTARLSYQHSLITKVTQPDHPTNTARLPY